MRVASAASTRWPRPEAAALVLPRPTVEIPGSCWCRQRCCAGRGGGAGDAAQGHVDTAAIARAAAGIIQRPLPDKSKWNIVLTGPVQRVTTANLASELDATAVRTREIASVSKQEASPNHSQLE